MYLSRVNVLAEQPDKLAEILKADHYQLHQLLWRLFPEKNETASRDFLFRRDDSKGFPVFCLLSPTEPIALAGVLAVESKTFNPQLKTGDKLRFTLRANPVEQVTKERTLEEQELLRIDRKKTGLRDKEIIPMKRVRHDVVMHLKNTLSDTEREKYSQAELEQQAGEAWLEKKAEKNGFKLLSVTAEGYQQHHFKKRGIKISTLDFNGILEVTEPELFIQKALYKGIGPAKAFGCGLLSIARI
jgi:CRISPR system Cascade subunit CasE